MRRLQALPRSVRMLVAGVVTVGVAAVALRAHEVSSWNLRDLGALALLVAATAVGENFHVAVPFGHQTKHVTITESAFAAALLLGVRPGVLTMAVGIGVAAVYASRRVASYKVAFNVGSYLAAVTAAELVFAAVRPAGIAFAIVPAMAAFFAVNASTVVGVIALAEGRSFRSVFAPIARLEFGHTALNLTAGLLLANVWLASPVLVPAVTVLPMALIAAYRHLAGRRAPAPVEVIA